ncbi:MAG: hypothetical protein ACI96M_000422 [Candidatus Azotimanducaceae bacterium]|jgi:hypothetical protein
MNDTPPSSQPGYVYMQSKAAVYLKMAPDVYRTQDAMGMPPDDATPEELALVELGMQLLLEGQGLTPDKPITGLGIHGFYCLASTLHFEREVQAIASMDQDHILDRINLVHAHDPDMSVTLYNRVEKNVPPNVRTTCTILDKAEFNNRQDGGKSHAP